PTPKTKRVQGLSLPGVWGCPPIYPTHQLTPPLPSWERGLGVRVFPYFPVKECRGAPLPGAWGCPPIYPTHQLTPPLPSWERGLGGEGVPYPPKAKRVQGLSPAGGLWGVPFPLIKGCRAHPAGG